MVSDDHRKNTQVKQKSLSLLSLFGVRNCYYTKNSLKGLSELIRPISISFVLRQIPAKNANHKYRCVAQCDCLHPAFH